MTEGPKDYCIKFCGSDEWADCIPGWYWGEVEETMGNWIGLGDTVGPFDKAHEAARDMAETLQEKNT